MSDVKISALPAVTSVATTDVIPVVTGGVTSKIGSQNFVNSGLSGGTANGLLYLNGSKAATSGSGLTFDGSILTNTNAIKGTNIIATGSLAAFNSATGGIYNFYTGGAGYLTTYTDNAGTLGATVLNGNVVAIQVNNSEGMRLTSTGLGIGTVNPQAKLHVQDSSYGMAQFGDSANTNYRGVVKGYFVSGSGARLGLGVFDSGAGYTEAITILQQSYGVVFNTGATAASVTERGRFSSDGTFRVKGAGTAGSTDAFQVSGSAPASAVVVSAAGNLNALTITEASSPVVVQTDIGTGANEIPLNGYLGGLAYEDTVMVSVPASASAAGVMGQIAQDGSYLYVCTAANTWKRVAIATW